MTELVLARAGALWRGLKGAETVWLAVLSLPVLILLVDLTGGREVVAIAVEAFAGTLPFILFAVLIIAWLKATGAEGLVAKAFQGRETRMIVFAALAGGVAPFCSCEVIPFVAALLAAGTPLSAVMAFWLASPLMDPPQFLITSAALGPEFAIGKVVAAVAIGLAGGFGVRALRGAGLLSDPLRPQCQPASCCGTLAPGGDPRPVWRFWPEPARRKTFMDTAWAQFLFLTKWLALAYLLEGLLIRYVPAEAIAGLVGGAGIGAIVLGALVGAPAYLNGYAAPALVAGLMEQGMSAGAAMAFMVAGAVSCLPAMAAVWALVRREVFGLYVLFGIGGAIVSGLVFAVVYPAL